MLSETVVSPMTGRYQMHSGVNFGFRSGSCINRTQNNLSDRNMGFEMKLNRMNADDMNQIPEKEEKQRKILSTFDELRMSDSNNQETIKIEDEEAEREEKDDEGEKMKNLEALQELEGEEDSESPMQLTIEKHDIQDFRS